MGKSKTLNALNSRFRMIGLSADWIYQAWLIKGTLTRGTVIFENEDNATYELVDFYYEDEQRVENVLYSGSLRDVIEFSSCLKETR
ncbi:hypothetical protein [Aeromonas media]|uniref:hypothetical protein n=1 Tax=Aeromonas media TaxID=651 RepID=UPI002B478C5B|nr:hypothetical protein [Aeromonas media]